MTFTQVKLVNERVLVKGTDVFGTEGSTVLDSSQWTRLAAEKQFETGTEEFDAAVKEFFAPLLEAADKVKATTEHTPDPIGFVVKQERVEAVAGEPVLIENLTRDSIILRLLEAGDDNRLAWVNDELEVLAADDAPVAVTVTDEAAVLEG